MADWFSQNAPKAPAPAAPAAAAGGWFASNAPKAEPAKPATSWLDSLGTFLGEATDSVNPKTIWKGLQAINPLEMSTPENAAQTYDRHRQSGQKPLTAALSTAGEYKPVAAVGNVLKAQGKLAEDAQKEFEAGNYGAGVVKALHYLIPVLGPQMQEAGDSLQRGEIAKGLGQTVDIAGQVVGPKVLGDAVSAVNRGGGMKVPGLGRGALSPEEARAVQFGTDNLPPGTVDAATATGNRAVRSVQHISDRSLGGSLVAGPAARQQSSAMATLGEQLAAKGYPSAMTKDAAGESMRGAVTGVVKRHAGDADDAYTMLRQIESEPERARTFEIARNPDPVTGEPLPAPANFAPRGAPKTAVFDAVYADAVKQGWKGSKQELRTAFEARVGQAKDLGGELASAADDFSNEALLREVRRIGLRPALKEGAGGTMVRGDFAPLVDTFRSGKWRQGGAASVFRKDGRALDEVVQLLNQDPRFEDLTANGLMSRLADIAAEGPSRPKMDLEGLLGAVDVKPGARWWDRDAVAADQAMAGDVGAILDGKHLVRTETVPLGVDLRGAKQSPVLRSLHDSLVQQRRITNQLIGAKGDALVALDTLLNEAPEVAPLSVVDGALGDLKAALRKGRKDGFLTEGQAATAQTVKELDQAVWAAAHEAGPDVVAALEQGRASTVAKYKAIDVLDMLKTEPVATIRAITAAKDGGLGKLREVARIAPAELPKVGRAYLDDLMAQANKDGGFDLARAKGIGKQWDDLGPKTKALLFDTGHVRDLDDFFRLARRMGENPNPAGTAHTLINYGQIGLMFTEPATGIGAQIGLGLVSKALHSRRGVQLLTQGMRVPVTSPAAAKVAADLARYVGGEGFASVPAPAFAGESDRRQP